MGQNLHVINNMEGFAEPVTIINDPHNVVLNKYPNSKDLFIV